MILEALDGRSDNVQVVIEITERALAADLAGVLAGAERLRAAGCAIALDDVGVEPESLALIPLLRPEVVKLDLGLLRTVSDLATITVAGAVRAYAEASGAEVVPTGALLLAAFEQARFFSTYDAARVTAAAHSLVGRLTPSQLDVEAELHHVP